MKTRQAAYCPTAETCSSCGQQQHAKKAQQPVDQPTPANKLRSAEEQVQRWAGCAWCFQGPTATLTRHLLALACRYEPLSLSAVATQPSSCLLSSTGTMSGSMTGSSSCSSCRASALRSWLLVRQDASTKCCHRFCSCWDSGGDLRWRFGCCCSACSSCKRGCVRSKVVPAAKNKQ